MEVKIYCDEDNLIITDESFEVDNYVTILIKRNVGQEDGLCTSQTDVPIEDLYSAVKAFYEKRTRAREANNLLK